VREGGVYGSGDLGGEGIHVKGDCGMEGTVGSGRTVDLQCVRGKKIIWLGDRDEVYSAV
jgi:hypothetical protein